MLSSGSANTCRLWVSRAMSALPSASTTACRLRRRRLSVYATPWLTRRSAVMWSKARPSWNTSRKSSSKRRGKACRLSTPSSLAAPASTLRNWALSIVSASLPPRLGRSGASGEPSQPSNPVICPLPPLSARPRPNRCSSAPPSSMSSLKSSAMRRAEPAAAACHWPLAVKRASGLPNCKRFKRHSAVPPASPTGKRLTASTASLPSLWPRSSKSSISMSSAGTLLGACSSRPTTESLTRSASAGCSDRRDRRALMRPAAPMLRGSRYSTLPAVWSAMP